MVNKVIDQYKEDNINKANVIPVHINLGHDAVLDTRHVLFNIISALKSSVEEFIEKNIKINFFQLFLISSIILIIDISYKNYISNVSYKDITNKIYNYLFEPIKNTTPFLDFIVEYLIYFNYSYLNIPLNSIFKKLLSLPASVYLYLIIFLIVFVPIWILHKFSLWDFLTNPLNLSQKSMTISIFSGRI